MAPGGVELPVQFTETGSGTTLLFELKKGILAKFTITHDGVDEFEAFLKDEDGNPSWYGERRRRWPEGSWLP